MKILLFILAILFVVYLVYKIRRNFTKKELLSFAAVILIIIAVSTYLTKHHENRLGNNFKKEYLRQHNIQIQKISYAPTKVQVLSSTKEVYDFAYIISKNNQEYVCNAKNVEVQQIEDEYIFSPYKEVCNLK